MSKLTRVFTLPLAALVCSVSALAQSVSPSGDGLPPPPASEYSPKAWREFSSPEGAFSIVMAASPVHVSQALDTAGGKVMLHVYVADSGAAKYAVAYADLPFLREDTALINAFLDGAARQAISHPGVRLVGEQGVSVGGLPAHEILVEDGKKVTRQWLFTRGARFYEVRLVTPENVAFFTGRPSYDPKDWTDLYRSMVAKFFGSFRFLPAQDGAGPSAGSGTAPAAEYDAEAWKELSPPGAGFSVLMVGSPSYRTQEVGSGADRIVRHVYTAGSVNAKYLVMYADLSPYPKEPSSIGQVLDAGRAAVLAGGEGMTVLSEREIDVGGRGGRELMVDGGAKFYRVRFFFAGGRLFQLEIETPTNAAFKSGRASGDEGDWTDLYRTTCEKFFGSFRLLPPTPRAGP